MNTTVKNHRRRAKRISAQEMKAISMKGYFLRDTLLNCRIPWGVSTENWLYGISREQLEVSFPGRIRLTFNNTSAVSIRIFCFRPISMFCNDVFGTFLFPKPSQSVLISFKISTFFHCIAIVAIHGGPKSVTLVE